MTDSKLHVVRPKLDRLARGVAAACVVVTLGLPLCAPAAELPPLDRSAHPVGFKMHGKRNDEDITVELVGRSTGFETMRDSNGCSWTRLAGDQFAPSSEWENCSGRSGKRSVTRAGDGFPLTVGSSWSYAFEDRRGRANERDCTVEGTETVTYDGVEREAYKVECIDRGWRREWVVVPDENVSVSTYRKHRKRGEAVRYELLRVETP